MIPALLIFLYRKYVNPKAGNKRVALKLFRKSLLIAILLLPGIPYAQEKVSVYNDAVIGKMQFRQKVDGDNLYLAMTSEAQIRFIYSFRVKTLDKSCFADGKLLHSSVYRNVNGKEKDNRKTRLVNDTYQVQAGNAVSQISSPIYYNMMLLYCREPVTINRVYSDNFQRFLSIKKTGTHSYRINLPDGNYNDYHFENGICSRVIVHQSLYTIQMVKS